MKVLCFLFLFSSISAFSQLNFQKRIEIVANKKQWFSYSSFYDKGAIVSYRDSKQHSNKFYYHFYNDEFDDVVSIQRDYSRFNNRYGSFKDSTTLYQYHLNKRNGDLKLCQLSIDSMRVKDYDLVLTKGHVIKQFVVVKNQMFAVIKSQKRDYILIISDFDSHPTYREIPLTDNYAFYELQVIDNFKKKEVAFILKSTLDNKDFVIHIFDDTGRAKGVISIDNLDYYVKDIYLLKKESQEYFISGAYSIDDNYSSNGFYYFNSMIGKGDSLQINEVVFTSISNIKLPNNQLKENRLSDFNVASHRVYESQDKYYYVGEFYRPGYRANTKESFKNGKPLPVTKSRSSFEGYQYTQAVIVCINKEGEVEWSNDVHLHPVHKPLFIKRWFNVSFEGNKMKLIYVDRSKYEVINIDNGNLEKGKMREVGLLNTKDIDDDVLYSSNGMVQKHSNGRVVVSGFQRINNRNEIKGLKPRKVFFFNVYKN